ncbi:hypothetical protein J2T04_001894 [Chryseobacterium lathyri]|uniref:Uncharacterized protein n=1 Tax=Chryseobacterium lathyri TaxID=395933 RepID=A0ABT9SNP0_9FLAO|nr:hypothetical protein [Chryseobacterium lathyri]MDQ0064429.1 hypothetical protein [Chryseobacterium lathyri]
MLKDSRICVNEEGNTGVKGEFASLAILYLTSKIKA